MFIRFRHTQTGLQVPGPAPWLSSPVADERYIRETGQARRTDADDATGALPADPRMAVVERHAIDGRIRLQIITAGFALHAFRITFPSKGYT